MPKPFPPLSREFHGKAKCPSKKTTAPVHLVVYHGTQGPTARGGAITLTTRTDGSAHEVHDSKEGFKIAGDKTVLCGVTDANTGVYHVEDATLAQWTRKLWFLHRRTLKWSAHQIAHALLRAEEPCRFIDLKEAQFAGGADVLHGWTYHCVLSATTWCRSTHYDPAANAGMGPSTFPHKWFKRHVDYYFDNPTVHEPVKLDKKGLVKGRA